MAYEYSVHIQTYAGDPPVARVEVAGVDDRTCHSFTAWESEPFDANDRAAADRALCAALRWLASDDPEARRIRARGFEVMCWAAFL